MREQSTPPLQPGDSPTPSSRSNRPQRPRGAGIESPGSPSVQSLELVHEVSPTLRRASFLVVGTRGMYLNAGEVEKDAHSRDEQRIAGEAPPGALYVIRTSVPAAALNGEDTVRSYKDLARIERAFRSAETMGVQDPTHLSPRGRPCAQSRLCLGLRCEVALAPDPGSHPVRG